MPASRKRRPKSTDLVWERPERANRPALAPLSREAIVGAAIALADAEGLSAVSLRKVAAALDAGPMRLYGYLSTKEELLDLMVDAVYGEIAPAEWPAATAGNWRDRLREIAGETRRASRRHPWFADLLGGRPHQGPHALVYLERVLAAMGQAPGGGHIDDVLQGVRTVFAYVVGALRAEANELLAERASGMTKTEWQAATGPYMERMIATGRFPTLAKVIREAHHPPAEAAFAAGLELVLDGLAVHSLR